MRVKRIALVTLGLMAAGAGVGGVVGALMAALWSVTASVSEQIEYSPGVVGGAVLGGVVGAVLGPAAAWLLLRQVPLGRAVGGTALGSLVGAAAGALAWGPVESFFTTLAGFGVAAVCLRLFTPRPARRIAAPARPAS